MGYIHSLVILSNHQMLAFGFFQNARHPRYIIQSRSQESPKYNVPHILIRMTRGQGAADSLDAHGLISGAGLLMLPDWWKARACQHLKLDHTLGLNTMRCEIMAILRMWSEKGDSMNCNKAILHYRKENVMLYLYG